MTQPVRNPTDRLGVETEWYFRLRGTIPRPALATTASLGDVLPRDNAPLVAATVAHPSVDGDGCDAHCNSSCRQSMKFKLQC